jgi:acetyl-CoA decarbonylase/synthase complex subunit gamma
VPRIDTWWIATDRWGAFKVRWNINRMDYKVVPGLYALGEPDRSSPVLVSANYKLSFDRLRRELPNIDAWILVLDTDGVNVWCAAGKGTFGTDELVARIEAANLAKVVDHRKLVLPQLGAPGVAAHVVAARTGFEVIWGPVRAQDIPAFLEAGGEATPEMRRVRFPIADRIAVIPVEVVGAAKLMLPVLVAVFLLGAIGDDRGFWIGALDHGLAGVNALLAGVVAGGILTPLLLPWLPGRAFAVKGAVVGLVVVAISLSDRWETLSTTTGLLEFAGWLLIGTAVASYLAMNFTGCSTYTSLSGVKKEMRFAVPLEIAGAVVGLSLWVTAMWVV